MRERPILMSGAMVRALLQGRKTQTRRPVKHKGSLPPDWATFAQELSSVDLSGEPTKIGLFRWSEEQTPGEPLKTLRRWPNRGPDPYDWYGIPCPYGKPGDRFWVREAWGLLPLGQRFAKDSVAYRADHGSTHGGIQYDLCKWRPSIHMPRWASRITLEIVSVRVERLNSISEEDAKAEGTQEPTLRETIGACWSEREAFAKLWESINGPDSWKQNPWVWVIEFKMINER